MNGKIYNRVCACGARPDGTESETTGDFVDESGGKAWICLSCWCSHNYGTSASEYLADLRAVPAVGSWGVLDSVWTPEDGWHWDGCRPSEWFHVRADAEAAARARGIPTWIAQVMVCQGGWTTGMAECVGWWTAQEIADGFVELTPQRVESTAVQLGLKGSAHRLSSCGEPIYSDAAVGLIERELRSRGHRILAVARP